MTPEPDEEDEQVREAILGALCDEWQRSSRDAILALPMLRERVTQVLPGADAVLRHNVQRLAEEACVGYRPSHGTVRLRARGVAYYQQLGGRRVVPDRQLVEVLEPLYEKSRQSPQAPAMTRERLQAETYLDPDELDRIVWYLKDVGVSISGVYLDAAGYLVVRTQGTRPWWLTAELNRFGKQLYEELA